jgi:RNA polymerase sigma-70 factor, ECF subfamily
MSDVALPHSTVSDFRSGDAAAFADVMRIHASLVRGIVTRYFRQTHEQEEALQEAWLQVLRQREAFDADRADELDRWIAVVVKRRCIDLLRAAGRRPADADAEGPEATEASATAPAQEDALESAELRAAVDAFKTKLKPGWREFFELHFVEGRSHPETAEALGVTVARSKYMKRVLVGRARKNRLLMEALGAGGRRAS